MVSSTCFCSAGVLPLGLVILMVNQSGAKEVQGSNMSTCLREFTNREEEDEPESDAASESREDDTEYSDSKSESASVPPSESVKIP